MDSQKSLQPPRRTTIVPSQAKFAHNSVGRRSTLAPSAQTTLKTRQLSRLNVQLAQLQANMADMENLLKVTTSQAENIRKLGIIHASL